MHLDALVKSSKANNMYLQNTLLKLLQSLCAFLKDIYFSENGNLEPFFYTPLFVLYTNKGYQSIHHVIMELNKLYVKKI